MKQTIRMLFSILRSPLLVGSAISAAFYAAVNARLIDNPNVDKIFAGHPIEYVTTTLFLIGLASLFNKAVAARWSRSFLSRSRGVLDRVTSSLQESQKPAIALMSEDELESGSGMYQRETVLEPCQEGATLELSQCGAIVEQLDREVETRPADKVTRRVRDVLDRMVRGGSVDRLDDELRHASDLEADRIYDEYALFRVVVWAVPILGFLGTVVGIATSIANLSPEAMEQSLPLVIASLGVAFATTIQALSLAIVLMFAKYRVDQIETQLMAAVDHAADRELLGKFQLADDSPDGQLLAIRRMAETVVNASEQLVRQQVLTSEQLVRQQAELWQRSIEASEKRWSQVTATAGKQLETALVTAMSKSLKTHAEELSKNEMILAQQNHEHWNHFTAGLQETVHSTTSLEESVERQVIVLQKTVEATGQVARLEEALNRNLAALNSANQLEQVATSLSAAIHLLSGRLAETPHSSIQLDSSKESSSAA